MNQKTRLSSCETPKERKIHGRSILCSPHAFVVQCKANGTAGRNDFDVLGNTFIRFFVKSETISTTLMSVR